MSWQRRGDWWAFDGWPDVSVRVTTRARGIPAGPPSAPILRAVAEAAGLSPHAVVGMEQCHGAGVAVTQTASDVILPGCDAVITDRPATALAVRTADCLPLVAYDVRRRVIGAAHAGWRGVKARLPARWIETFIAQCSSRPEDLRVAIGPAIGPCCYEVGQEFEPWFPGFLQNGGRAGDRRRLDLASAASAQLREAGIPASQLIPPPVCTACTMDTCHSYRRDGPQAGRLVTLISL